MPSLRKRFLQKTTTDERPLECRGRSENSKYKGIVDQIEDQVKKGVPRMHILRSLWRISLDGMSISDMDAIVKIRDSIEGTMVDRNMKGKASEKEGRIIEAMALYEANVTDCFDGSWPYDRLAKIYSERGDYVNAIRVYKSYLNNTSPAQSEKEYSRINQYINEWENRC